MNPRLPTILDDLFPDSLPEFSAIAEAWPEHVVIEMLSLVWAGFDRLKALPRFSEIDFTGVRAQLERSLTDLHMDEITILYRKSGTQFASFIPKHEAWEFQALTQRSARPPSCDLGFVLLSNRRIRWSVEVKVLNTAKDVSEYLADLQKYLDAKSSPFAVESALAGYLVSGDPSDTFEAIEQHLKCAVLPHLSFIERRHRLSDHLRNTSRLPKGVPREFRCHHLIFELTSNPSQLQGKASAN